MSTLKEGTYRGKLYQLHLIHNEVFIFKSIIEGKVTGEVSYDGGAASFTGICSPGFFSITSHSVIWGDIALSTYWGTISNNTLKGQWRAVNNGFIHGMSGTIILSLDHTKATPSPSSPSPSRSSSLPSPSLSPSVYLKKLPGHTAESKYLNLWKQAQEVREKVIKGSLSKIKCFFYYRSYRTGHGDKAWIGTLLMITNKNNVYKFALEGVKKDELGVIDFDKAVKNFFESIGYVEKGAIKNYNHEEYCWNHSIAVYASPKL